MSTQLKISLVFFSLAGSFILAAHSYGTSDVYVAMEIWTRNYIDNGFWQGYWNTTSHPHFMALIYFIVGRIVLFIGQPLGSQAHIVVLKSVSILLIQACGLLLLNIKRTNSRLLTVLLLTFLLNPVFIEHTSILGYTDAYYYIWLALSLYLSFRLSQKSDSLTIMLFFLTLVIGPFTKWEFLIYTPALFIPAAVTVIKSKSINPALLGAFIGLVIVVVPLLITAETWLEFSFRARGVLQAWQRITTDESFVVANFGNVWQILNYVKTFHISTVADFFSHLSERFPFWWDPVIHRQGRLVFFSVFMPMALLAALKTKVIKSNPFRLTLALVLWTNLIYVLFNTGVHENHFVVSTLFAAFLMVSRWNLTSLIWYLLISWINFSTLSYFYGFGRVNMFGLTGNLNLWGLNISLVNAFLLILIFIYNLFHLVHTRDEYLG